MPPIRFLDTLTQTLVVKTPKQLKQEGKSYAILSHVWDQSGEVVYQDLVDGTGHLKPERSREKLRRSCERALRDNYKYIWIDTCCIDKSSSSELSEAINSMYAWYQEASECYAFLDDAPDLLDTPAAKDAFRRSVWFTRGWTLQELLAPKTVVFFSKNWECLGEKTAISPLLADITKIDEDILRGHVPMRSASIAKRMSWASLRETTRPEDLAYCLMGLFGVNMPMLYGEGELRAFLRLQEEIMKSSDDQSLFAWADRRGGTDADAPAGLLAPSPAAFTVSSGMLPYQDWEPREPYMMTNRGLHIQLHLTALGDDVFVAALDCPVPPDYQDGSFLAIYLRKISSHGEDDQNVQGQQQHYARIRIANFASVQQRGKRKWIYVRQDQQQTPLHLGVMPQNILQLRNGPSPRKYTLQRVVGCCVEDDAKSRPAPMYLRQSSRSWVPVPLPLTFRLRKGAGQLTVGLIFTRDDGEALAVVVGFVSGFQVGFGAFELAHPDDDEDDDDDDDKWGRSITMDELTLQKLEATAQLSPSGRIETEFHSVRCSVTTAVQNAHKYYLVDIGIEDIKRSLRETLAAEAANVLGRAVGVDMSPLQGLRPDTVSTSSGFKLRGKYKAERIWPWKKRGLNV